jgi:hypothetical protein
MSNLYRGPAIDASYQGSVHLAKWFQRRRLNKIGQSETRIASGSQSIYGRSSIKIAHFVPIRYQTWLPQTILVSDWLISKKSSPLKPLCQMNRNLLGSIRHVCKQIGT